MRYGGYARLVRLRAAPRTVRRFVVVAPLSLRGLPCRATRAVSSGPPAKFTKSLGAGVRRDGETHCAAASSATTRRDPTHPTCSDRASRAAPRRAVSLARPDRSEEPGPVVLVAWQYSRRPLRPRRCLARCRCRRPPRRAAGRSSARGSRRNAMEDSHTIELDLGESSGCCPSSHR